MNISKNKNLRKPIVEGIFYPSDKEELNNLIDSYIQNKVKGYSNLIISPHAGYAVTGQQMADAFLSAAASDIKEVVIISSVHREEQEKIILPGSSGFQTAAGELSINMKSLHLFKGDDPSIIRDEIPHLEEHAIEDQLPFISKILGDVQILPILLGKTTITMVKKLTKALERAYSSSPQNILFVITSNLSLYEEENAALDKADKALKAFKRGDWREICELKRTWQIDACGAGGLAAVLALYDKSFNMDVISRSKSEGKESEKGKIVSYGAITFSGRNNA
ncbi:MAG: AmmeMemoRadiSam system protein B [Spirochaetaceae bacterium]|jgi:AmmeMemoRadiSam system protein B|nr:AmmeMemoRadiSam system protein B [Spirochaetaceae bacterium]